MKFSEVGDWSIWFDYGSDPHHSVASGILLLHDAGSCKNFAFNFIYID